MRSRHIERSIEPVLEQAVREFPVVVLAGPKQAGKSTLLQHLFGRDYRLISLDQDPARTNAAKVIRKQGSRLVLDGIEHASDLLGDIEEQVKAGRCRPGQFLLTCSRDLARLDVEPVFFFGDKEKALESGLLEKRQDEFGPAVPPALRESLKSGKFRNYLLKASRTFVEDPEAFDRISSAVRGTRPRGGSPAEHAAFGNPGHIIRAPGKTLRTRLTEKRPGEPCAPFRQGFVRIPRAIYRLLVIPQ